jgi:hypothetical protein
MAVGAMRPTPPGRCVGSFWSQTPELVEGLAGLPWKGGLAGVRIVGGCDVGQECHERAFVGMSVNSWIEHV